MADLYIIGTENNETGFLLTSDPQTPASAKRAIDWQYSGQPITTKFFACIPGVERETFLAPNGVLLQVPRGIYTETAWNRICEEIWGAAA